MEISGDRKDYRYDVLVASPNAALDSYYILPGFEIGSVNRAEKAFHTAGGKGNNFARAFHSLGGRVLSLGIAGGSTGHFIADALIREDIPCDFVWTDSETRRSSTIIVPEQMQTTVVLDLGCPGTPEDGSLLFQKIYAHVLEAPFFVMTGSLPPGLPVNYYADILEKLTEVSSLNVCLDSSGPVLYSAAQLGPAIIKVNSSEYLRTFSTETRLDLDEVRRTSIHLQKKGNELLIITDGAQGAYVFPRDLQPFKVVTRVDAWVSTAGAGDTFMAGLILSLVQGNSISEAAVFASACAAATLQQIVCGSLDGWDVERFLPLTEIHLLP